MSIFHENMLLGASASTSQYQLQRSLRFTSADSAFLSRTSVAGNRKTWTWAGWVKRSSLTATEEHLWIGGVGQTTDTTYNRIWFNSSNKLIVSSFNVAWRITTQVFRDFSAWFHLVVAVDTTLATASSRVRIYVNGVEVTAFDSATDPTQNQDTGTNSTALHYIGAESGPIRLFNGYLADLHLIDGQQLTPSSFGEFDATTGVWMPKAYSGSYGTNGFKLNFSDNSAATATTLGKDSSGNGNNWTPNNLSVTAGAGNDSLVDVPTNGSEVDTGAGGEVRGNYATFNPLANFNRNGAAGGGGALKDGNLVAYSISTAETDISITAKIPTSGKYYLEIRADSVRTDPYIWIYPYGNMDAGGRIVVRRPTSGELVGMAFDRDANNLYVYVNNVLTTTITTMVASLEYTVGIYDYAVLGWQFTLNAGQRPFAYPKSGYKALCTANLPAPVVTKPSTVMDVKLYTGNSSTQAISGLGFSPDFVWLKKGNGATSHRLFDVVRGATKNLYSNTTDAEGTDSTSLSSFDSTGFSLGDNGAVNALNEPYAAWCWDAGSSTVTNTQGSITSQVRANASAGFSIVTYTGNGTNGATVGHGLGVAPEFFIFKQRSVSGNWIVVHKSIPYPWNNYSLRLNTTDAVNGTQGTFGNVAPTSSVITLWASSGTPTTNANTETYVAYCFAPVAGYSSFGSYTGNGSADGPFVYTGFRPRFLLIKCSNGGFSWQLLDTARSDYNQANAILLPNDSSSELTYNGVDFLSNGFKLRGTSSNLNGSANTYVYYAAAEHPFAYARAR